MVFHLFFANCAHDAVAKFVHDAILIFSQIVHDAIVNFVNDAVFNFCEYLCAWFKADWSHTGRILILQLRCRAIFDFHENLSIF